MFPASPARILCAAAILTVLGASASHAQNATAPAAKVTHPAVCGKGVRIYTSVADVPTPHDTLTMPPADGPVRVTNEAEMEAAELAMRARAGSVGATGVIVEETRVEEGGQVRVSRNVTAVYVPKEAERAQQACK